MADGELQQRMSAIGAVMIDRPKAVGKTRTAERVAKTVLRMDCDHDARATAQIQLEQLSMETPPIVFDEWQEVPELWKRVRRAVDDNDGKGLYILTGSARPWDNARMHSGVGRIGRLRIRPMSLFEAGHSSGQVSLKGLLSGEDQSGRAERLTIRDLLERIVIDGWLDLLDATERETRTWLRDYLRNVTEVDVPGIGLRRNLVNIEKLLTALGRTAATPLNLSALARDTRGARGAIALETLSNYLDALDRLMLLKRFRPGSRT